MTKEEIHKQAALAAVELAAVMIPVVTKVIEKALTGIMEHVIEMQLELNERDEQG